MKEAKVLFSNDVLLGDASIMKLDYSLTEQVSENDHQNPYYGVRITKHLNDQIEADEVTGISSSRDRVVAILRKLCQYEVTPISLVEILDDLETQEELAAQGKLITQGI
jgi:flagellar basal body P-ring protein FlgI